MVLIRNIFWITMISTSSLMCTAADWITYYNQRYAHFSPKHRWGNDYYGNFEFPVENNERTHQSSRVSERSIALGSEGQNIWNDNRRYQGNYDDRIPRRDNGSLKILNKPPVIENRRGIDSDQNKKNPFKPNISQKCLQMGLCEELQGYPEQHVDEVIKKIGDTNSLFRVDELMPPQISQRFGSPEEIHLCNTNESIIYPLAAPKANGDWYIIVNKRTADTKGLQGYRVEMCSGKPEERCSASLITYDEGNYRSMCKQNRALRYMTALDYDGTPFQDAFVIPSCCSCVFLPTKQNI